MLLLTPAFSAVAKKTEDTMLLMLMLVVDYDEEDNAHNGIARTAT